MYEVIALFTKPAKGAPMRSVDELVGIEGHGIEGDISAHPASPRHALLVTQSDLDALGVSARDLRVNIVVDNLRNLSSGSIITFGTLALRIAFPCEPCGKLDRIRKGLRKEMGERRLLATVHASGRMRIGDRGVVSNERGPVLSIDWRERVRSVATPSLSYSEIARLAGVDTSYCRAFPRVLNAPPIRSTRQRRTARP